MKTLPAPGLLGAGLLLLELSARRGESLQGALEASVNRLDLTLVGTVILEVGEEAGYRVTADEAEALDALRIETRGVGSSLSRKRRRSRGGFGITMSGSR